MPPTKLLLFYSILPLTTNYAHTHTTPPTTRHEIPIPNAMH